MKISLLYSGGKDSSLAALILSQIYEVELVTCNFNLLPTYKTAELAAEKLKLPHRTIFLDVQLLEEAVKLLISDGYPRNAINYLHHQALEHLARSGCRRVADGTRRNDRAPKLTISQIQRLEDKYNLCYLAPLMGFGAKTVNELAERYFILEAGESNIIGKADYEAELRALAAEKLGFRRAAQLFPYHVQSQVRGIKNYLDVNCYEFKDKGKEEAVSQSP
jgi:hypothetical protein